MSGTGGPPYSLHTCPECGGKTPIAQIQVTGWSDGVAGPTRADGTGDCPTCGEVDRRIP